MKLISLLPALMIALAPALAPAADTPDPKKKEQPGKKADAKKPDAKKPEPKKPGARKPPVRTDMVEEDVIAILKPYDRDGNFEIDVDEMEALAADFKKAPKGPLKQFDKGSDGALDMLIDRTGINVKLGAGAPKTKPAAKKPAAKPAPAKKAEPKQTEPKKESVEPKKD